jgi:hypothetical protein
VGTGARASAGSPKRVIFLIPDEAYQAAQNSAGGAGFVEPESDLRKRLDEKGILIVSGAGEFNRRTVRRRFSGTLQSVLWLKPGAITISCARTVRTEEPEPEITFDFGAKTGTK